MKNKQKKQLIDIIQPYVTFAVIAFFIFTCCRGIYNIYNRNKKEGLYMEYTKEQIDFIKSLDPESEILFVPIPNLLTSPLLI